MFSLFFRDRERRLLFERNREKIRHLRLLAAVVAETRRTERLERMQHNQREREIARLTREG